MNVLHIGVVHRNEDAVPASAEMRLRRGGIAPVLGDDRASGCNTYGVRRLGALHDSVEVGKSPSDPVSVSGGHRSSPPYAPPEASHWSATQLGVRIESYIWDAPVSMPM